MANEAETERMEIVRKIQKQTNEANAERVAKFGPPKYLGPNAAARQAALINQLAASRGRMASDITLPIDWSTKGGK